MKHLYRKYLAETAALKGSEILDFVSFERVAADRLQDLEYIEIVRGQEIGFLYYELTEEDGRRNCYVPSCGYYAESGQMLVRLIQKLAQTAVTDLPCDFTVCLYAHDTELINALHMMQFGTMAEKRMLRLTRFPEELRSDAEIRVLDKEELQKRWPGIWALTRRIIRHMQMSPIFYPGEEFTEDIYRAFYMDENTEVLAAYIKDQMVGMIEWNRDTDELFCPANAANVGEVYVLPEHRGKGISHDLLAHAVMRAQQARMSCIWLEHGTANPNAVGFSNRYFETYQYELVRSIDPVKLS